jgi:hypothetical protein
MTGALFSQSERNMVEFVNEFRVKAIPDMLVTSEVSFDAKYQTQSKFDYKAAAQVSRKLSEEMKIPVASLGSLVLTEEGVSLPPSVNVTMKIDGLPTDVEIGLRRSGEITGENSKFAPALRKYLNRQVDVILRKNGFRQEGRGFYENSSKDMSKYYSMYEGIHVSARTAGEELTLVVDPVTQVRAKLNLLDMLKLELSNIGVDDWRKVGESAPQINKLFRGKAFNLRSTYEEPHRDEPQHNVYRFAGFRFDKGVADSSDPRSPIEFHKKFGREIPSNQPIVEVVSQDGRTVDHVPSLLEELPTQKTLKRFGASGKVHERSLKDANTRYYMTSTLVKPLSDAGLIEPNPTQVSIEQFGPVRLTVEGDYLDIGKNLDFQGIFKKKKLLKVPTISKIIVFSTAEDHDKSADLVKELLRVIREFKLPAPEVVEKSSAPSNFENFYKYVSNELKNLKPASHDLGLVVFGFEDEDIESSTYTNLKKESLQSLYLLQFVNTDTIEHAVKDGNLKEGVANPMFLQIVAKCGGQPYGLQPGFVPTNTIFVGIDLYHQPFKRNAPTIISVTLFDSEGAYICGDSDIVQYGQFSAEALEKLLKESLASYQQQKSRDPLTIVYMIDTGMGTIEGEIRDIVQVCADLASGVKAKHIFVTGNKGSHLRLYSGDQSDLALTAERVPPFSAAVDMREQNQIIVVSTEPIVSRAHSKEFGTPRSTLYTIVSTDIPIHDAKMLVAKSTIWLCRHAWISPASTREPAPIFFGNRLSRLVAATGVRISPDRTTAALFL